MGEYMFGRGHSRLAARAIIVGVWRLALCLPERRGSDERCLISSSSRALLRREISPRL